MLVGRQVNTAQPQTLISIYFYPCEVCVWRWKQFETNGRLMNNQMSLTSPLMWSRETIYQLFDVQLLLSQQLQYFKAAVFRNNLTKISCHKTKAWGYHQEPPFRLKRNIFHINDLDFMTQPYTIRYAKRMHRDKEKISWIYVFQCKDELNKGKWSACWKCSFC